LLFRRTDPPHDPKDAAMMFRETPGATIAISQPSHAWLSGQIIRAWGNAEFGTVTPSEDVCLGAEQHDIGWLTWEHAPTLNPATGRPHAFRELSIAEHTAIWRHGTDLAQPFGRYPALLVSLHGTGLYANFEGTPADTAIVRDFLNGQQQIQQRLIDSLNADERMAEFATPAMIERNRGLVRTADRMSIAICSGLRDVAVRSDNPDEGIVRQVPTAAAATEIRLSARDNDLATIAVSPWPFAAASVRLTCEGTLLPSGPFEDAPALRLALRSAKRLAVTAELRPAA
jgi:hypothetical protein